MSMFNICGILLDLESNDGAILESWKNETVHKTCRVISCLHKVACAWLDSYDKKKCPAGAVRTPKWRSCWKRSFAVRCLLQPFRSTSKWASTQSDPISFVTSHALFGFSKDQFFQHQMIVSKHPLQSGESPTVRPNLHVMSAPQAAHPTVKPTVKSQGL